MKGAYRVIVENKKIKYDFLKKSDNYFVFVTGSANQADTRKQCKHTMKSIICMGKYLRQLV